MSKRERDKGIRGENEVRHLFVDHGWTMRGLEGLGDHIAILVRRRVSSEGAVDDRSNLALHVEVKRQETLKLPAWLRQAAAEAPEGTVPIVCFRQNRSRWYAALSLDDLLKVLR